MCGLAARGLGVCRYRYHAGANVGDSEPHWRTGAGSVRRRTPCRLCQRHARYSQMLAVAKEYWNGGIGFRLKLAQRDQARQRGIRLIEWTFDPLESKNAHLNVAKLGVIVRRYYVNLHGVTTSRLQQGLESDRVIAEWWIDQAPIRADPDARRILIPADIQSLKKQSLKAAQDVQLRIREQFLENFQDDYFVAGFERSAKPETNEW